VAGNAEAISDSILVQLLASIVDLIRESDEAFWNQMSGFSRESVIQFCLDLRWMQEASTALGLSTPKLLRDLESCIQRVILEFCSRTGERNPKKVLPKQSFFSEILDSQLAKLLTDETK